MDTKKFVFGTLAGGITFFLLGWLFYGVVFAGFFEQNGGTASNVMKEMPIFWALILGELAYGALYTLIFLRWANISTFATGAQAGAMLGLLMSLAYGLINYGTTNLYNLTALLGDLGIAVVSGAIAGGVIGWVLSRS